VWQASREKKGYSRCRPWPGHTWPVGRPTSSMGWGSLWRPPRSTAVLKSPFLKLFGPSPFRAFDSLRLDEGLGLSGGYLVSWAKAAKPGCFQLQGHWSCQSKPCAGLGRSQVGLGILAASQCYLKERRSAAHGPL